MTRSNPSPPAEWFWVSSPRATVALRTVQGKILHGPPIIRRHWLGRQLSELIASWKADRVVSLGPDIPA